MTDTPPKAKSSGLRAVEYAEQELKVHEVYNGAMKRRNDLEAILSQLAELRDKLRFEEVQLADAETQVAIEERGKHPDMSISGMERHLKIKLRESDEVRERKETLAKLRSEIDRYEFDKQIAETDIKIATARMIELGGYIQYLAVIKERSPKA